MVSRPRKTVRPSSGVRPRAASPSNMAASSAPAHDLQDIPQSLWEIQDKQHIMLEITDTAAAFLDEEGRVLDANSEYVRISGHHVLDDILGRSVIEWTAPHDRARNDEEVKKIVKTGRGRGLIVDYEWHDGTIVPVEIDASILKTNVGTVIVAVCRDISQRRRNERLMIAQRDLALAIGTTQELAAGLRLCLLSAIQVSSMDCGGIYLRDRTTGDMVMQVHEGLSPSFVAAVERCPADSSKTLLIMRGVPVYQEYAQINSMPDQVHLEEGLHAIAVIPLRAGGSIIGCMNMASHSLKEVPQFPRIALEAMAAQTSNVIERLRLLGKLQSDRKLFVAGPVIVIKWGNSSSEPLQYISPNFATQFGYPTEHFLGGALCYRSLIHPDDLPRCDAEILNYQREQHPWYEQEYRIRHVNGEYHWIHDFTMMAKNTVSDGARRLCYLQDITEQKRVREEQRKTEMKMFHAQKLESLGGLAGGIAHDFNNILVAVMGNIDLALMTIPPASPMHKSLNDARQASQCAADLCRKMLAYAGRGSYQLQPHNLTDVVSDMHRMLESSIAKKIHLHFELDQHLPAVKADLSQLHQIVMNLVINAAEAVGDESGMILVRTGTMECNRALLLDTLLGEKMNEGHGVYIEVADTGCGMDAATQAQIFDPFYSTKSTGRGLGLASVFGIVRAHHGAVKVTSELGHGSTFRVILPVMTENIMPTSASHDDASEWRGSGTLLLVDDEATVLAVGKQMLERLGFTVCTASNGPAAIEMFRAHADDIRVVILDLTMPQMDGEETFPILRNIKGDRPVLLASGYSEQELAQRLDKQGFAGFIQKPYTITTLTTKLRAILPEDN